MAVKKPTGPKPNLKQTLEIIDRELEAGNVTRAETIAAHLHVNYPRRAEVNVQLGDIMAMQDQHDVALHFHQLAAGTDRHNTTYLAKAGRDMVKMGRAAEAEAIYNRILEIDPNAYSAAWALGSFYHEIGLGERALARFEQAAKLAPARYAPKINLGRLNCLVGLGRTEECEKEFERGFETSVYRPQYVSLYAMLDKWNVNSQAYSLVMGELQDQRLTTDERATLLSRQASIEENSGLYDEAFDTQLKAKRLSATVYDMNGFRRQCDERSAAFSADLLSRCRERFGHPSTSHVFVIGMPRSGTTLTEQIIASHSQAGGAGELETMSYLSHKLANKRAISEIEAAIEELGADAINHFAEEYERVTEFLAPGKAKVVDKMPHNFQRVGEISILFPNARFVHCVRNAADTFISAFQNDMSEGHAYSYAPALYAEYYAEYIRLMRHWYAVTPGRIFTLEYEKLVTSPEQVIRDLLAFLDLPWEEACLNPQNRGALVKTFSRVQVRSAINSKSVGRWRKYEQQLAPLAKRFENLEPFPARS